VGKDGWIKLHRKLIESDIFCWKPPEWLKIWIYILLTVNFDDGNLPRGTGYFRRAWEDISDENSESKITEWQWHNCIRFLKKEHMITTQKTTRGMRLKVLKYENYQIREPNQSNTASKTQARHKQDTSNTILKECKKTKNERTKILSQIENLKLQFPSDIKSLIEEYIEVARDENETKRILPNKERRLINELLLIWIDCDHEINKKDFEQALKVAVNNKAPNPNYVRKVMKSRENNRKLKLEKANKIWK